MTYAARSRRTVAVLAALSLGALTLTACGGGDGADKAASGATASATAAGTDQGKDADTGASAEPAGGATPSATTGGSASSGGTGGSGSSGGTGGGDSGSGTGDRVRVCRTAELTYKVVVASRPVNHALLTATNSGSKPCLLPTSEPVITFPALDGAAGHMGPAAKGFVLKGGDSAYAGIMLSRADVEGGKSVDSVNIALDASQSPTEVTVVGGPVTLNDPEVTSFFKTAEDALTY
ncbi:hypothetical protein GCM10020367_43710 [Streptomyces sannanensis]|uniref:DUF4232 domain-containing protein n=1 Tax=Streptomyces sannanensis TaxID=285536 RepID=A0ABP6SFK0_9ACTN